MYHIKTEDENYPHARKAIASIMEDELGYKQGAIWNKGLYQLKNDREPSMLNALHIYYEFSYNEELDVYVYTFVRPYDDWIWLQENKRITAFIDFLREKYNNQ